LARAVCAGTRCLLRSVCDTCVSLGKLDCEIPQSSFVHQICHDAKDQHMVTLLRDTWYHYCQIPQGIVTEFENAESVGMFYKEFIKGRFGCQGLPVPMY
jgi:hypothetical protein